MTVLSIEYSILFLKKRAVTDESCTGHNSKFTKCWDFVDYCEPMKTTEKYLATNGYLATTGQLPSNHSEILSIVYCHLGR